MRTFAPKTGKTLLALGLTFCAVGIAHAQPDVNNGAKADNPTNRAPRNRIQERFRTQLVALGVTDAATQQTVLNYVEAELTAHTTLMTKGRQLQTGLRGGILTDAQVAALLNDYQGAVEDDKARHAKSEAAFKKALDLSKMPKVEATLTLMGIYGDGPDVTSVGNNAVARQGRGGRNGRNGADAGNFGGGNGGGGNGGGGNAAGNPAPAAAPANPVF